MIDFGVCMRDEVLEHKLRDGKLGQSDGVYWEFGNGLPKGVRSGSRMWVANHGRWVGYFIVDEPGQGEIPLSETGNDEAIADPDWNCDSVIFWSNSFVRIDGGPRSPFVGYTLKVPPRGQK